MEPRNDWIVHGKVFLKDFSSAVMMRNLLNASPAFESPLATLKPSSREKWVKQSLEASKNLISISKTLEARCDKGLALPYPNIQLSSPADNTYHPSSFQLFSVIWQRRTYIRLTHADTPPVLLVQITRLLPCEPRQLPQRCRREEHNKCKCINMNCKNKWEAGWWVGPPLSLSPQTCTHTPHNKLLRSHECRSVCGEEFRGDALWVREGV